MNYNYRLNSFINRAINFFKPKSTILPANIEDILDNNKGLNIVEKFSDLYYQSRGQMEWRGSNLIKNPCDLFTLIDLLGKLKPGLIIETGTAEGGSALFMRDMLDLLNIDCQIVTIDVNPKWGVNPLEKGISSFVGTSTDQNIYKQVKDIAHKVKESGRHILVTLDSDHSEKNVSEELSLYSPLVTVGSYCIVEDTNVNGHPSFSNHGPGPWEAAQKFIKLNDNFVIDNSMQNYLLTFNPDGYLKRIY